MPSSFINVPYQEVRQQDLQDPNLTVLNNYMRGVYQSVQALNTQAKSTVSGTATGSASTGMVAAGDTVAVRVSLSPSLSSNNFVPSIAVQDSTGSLTVVSFAYFATAGSGVTVYLKNNGTGSAKGTVMVRAVLS